MTVIERLKQSGRNELRPANLFHQRIDSRLCMINKRIDSHVRIYLIIPDCFLVLYIPVQI